MIERFFWTEISRDEHGRWLLVGRCGKRGILQDSTTHVECIAKPDVVRLIPHGARLLGASHKRKTFYQPFRREWCTKRQLCKMELPGEKRLLLALQGSSKRRIDTLHIHSRPMDQNQQLQKTLCDLCAILESHLEPLARPQLLAVVVEQDWNRAQG